MKRPRIGLVGAGQHNWWFLSECLKQTPSQIVAVADPDREIRQRYADLYRVENLYETGERMFEESSLDAVFVFPGSSEFLPVALAAIHRGVAVFADKHLARSLEEVDLLQEALRKSPVHIGLRLNKPVLPAYRAGLAVLSRDDGIGRPLVYSSDFHAGPYGSLSNFVNNHVLVHLDLAFAALGPCTVHSALVNRVAPPSVGVVLMLQSASWAIGVMNASSYSPGDSPKERLEPVGMHGTLRVENARRIQLCDGSQRARRAPEGFGLA